MILNTTTTLKNSGITLKVTVFFIVLCSYNKSKTEVTQSNQLIFWPYINKIQSQQLNNNIELLNKTNY